MLQARVGSRGEDLFWGTRGRWSTHSDLSCVTHDVLVPRVDTGVRQESLHDEGVAALSCHVKSGAAELMGTAG